MQILSALIAVAAPALCTLTGFDFRRELVLERMNSSLLKVEECYNHMADQVQSAIFSGFDSRSGMSQEQRDAAARNVDFVLGRLGSRPIGDVSAVDDAFSAVLHELFVNSLLLKVQRASEEDASYNALDILVLYNICLQSAEHHGMVPHTAFPFQPASNRLVSLLRLINWTSSLELGDDVESIGNRLAMIRELFWSSDASCICSEPSIQILANLRSLFVDECRQFFSVVPEEYSSMHPDVVMNAFNAFRLVENMLSLAMSIALLPEEGTELLDDAVEMAKAHVAHVVVGCVKRSVPIDTLVRSLTSGPGPWYLKPFGSAYNYVFNIYPQDVYPSHAVSIFKPVADAPSSSLDAEAEQVEAEESMPSEDVPEKPSRIYRNTVFGLLFLTSVGTLTSIPLYFLRRKSRD